MILLRTMLTDTNTLIEHTLSQYKYYTLFQRVLL